ncbi:hypothetical protein SALBM311S_09152 [Streptomyces alboniger]
MSAAREEVSDTPETGDRGRRYFVTLEDGPPLDVTVVDREQQAQGFFYRAWRNLTLRGFATRSSLPSLRQALEQEALLAYAAIAAGANAPKLIATSNWAPTQSSSSTSTPAGAPSTRSRTRRSPTTCCATPGSRCKRCSPGVSPTAGSWVARSWWIVPAR